MENKPGFISRLLEKKNASTLVVSINDLREKEFSGKKLSHDERLALSNFDRYRLSVLNAEKEDEKFHLKYRQLQVIANLSDWKEFLHGQFGG